MLVMVGRDALIPRDFDTPTFFWRATMFKSVAAKLSFATAFSALAMLLAPQSAMAARGVSQGNGVKCNWVVVANPAPGHFVYKQVCRKGV